MSGRNEDGIRASARDWVAAVDDLVGRDSAAVLRALPAATGSWRLELSARQR